jgi:hypothetical protein
MTTDGERETRRCRASLKVALRGGEAFELFTPEGERVWAPGWDPRYLSAGLDRSARGTAFVTAHGGNATTWLVVACDPGIHIVYARVGEWVGSVEVRVRPGDADCSIVDVEYVLTPTDALSDRRLEHFAADYTAYIATWSAEIERYLRPRPVNRPGTQMGCPPDPHLGL